MGKPTNNKTKKRNETNSKKYSQDSEDLREHMLRMEAEIKALRDEVSSNQQRQSQTNR